MNVNNTNHSNNTNNIKINITNNNIDAEDFMFKIWNIYLDLESIKGRMGYSKRMMLYNYFILIIKIILTF